MEYAILQKKDKPDVFWQDIKLVIFDCDGVLTDGKIIYSGEVLESKHFNAHDGMGFGLLHRGGLISAVITGRTSEALSRRCNDLFIQHVLQGVQNKLKVAQDLVNQLGLSWNQVAYMGDDWNDIPVMQSAAYSFTPCDAPSEIRKLADYVTPHAGGDGAVRDCIDFILYQKGLYEKVAAQYLQEIS